MLSDAFARTRMVRLTVAPVLGLEIETVGGRVSEIGDGGVVGGGVTTKLMLATALSTIPDLNALA
jgi:hypothetical protein